MGYIKACLRQILRLWHFDVSLIVLFSKVHFMRQFYMNNACIVVSLDCLSVALTEGRYVVKNCNLS